jgi:hypothetical protein
MWQLRRVTDTATSSDINNPKSAKTPEDGFSLKDPKRGGTQGTLEP